MSGEPLGEKVFYVKCRPRGVDLWPFAKDCGRVFVGYPPWRRPVSDRLPRKEWSAAIWDISADGFDSSLVTDIKWRPMVSGNRTLATQIGRGSIVLVPRLADGVCHAGRVIHTFEVMSDPAYIEKSLAHKVAQKYTTDLDFWGDVAQSWSIALESWVDIPFVHLPGSIRYRLLSQNSAGIIHDKTAGDVLRHLMADPGRVPIAWTPTSDLAEILDRMRYHLTPTAFEHLVVDLLQLENPGEHWLHVGGSGDGGADGIGFDDSGRKIGIVQCKWMMPSRSIKDNGLPDAPRRYIATLDADCAIVLKKMPRGVTPLCGQELARMLVRHSQELPLARSLGVGVP